MTHKCAMEGSFLFYNIGKDVIRMPTLQERLERLGWTCERAMDAVRAHAQAGKLFELERYISVKEHVLEVLG